MQERVWGSRVRVSGLGFRVFFGVWGLGFFLGFRVLGLGFRI